MPPAILADSDDDGDEISFEKKCEKPALVSGNNEPGMLDGANEQSTGSTERLRNQIRSAERSLFAPTEKQAQHEVAMSAPMIKSSGSPTERAGKRRHSSVFDSEPLVSPGKRAKRTKTVTTYSTKRASTHYVNDESGFSGMQDRTEPLVTSQSAHFTEHSGVASSGVMPAGSVQADFVNHEPNVMFRDSGTTVADNETTQRRLVEQALSARKGIGTSSAKAPSEDDPKSSSFPWSASEQTPSADKHGTGSGRIDQGEDTTMEPGLVDALPTDAQVVEQPGCEEPAANKPRSSPRVEVAIQPEHVSTPDEASLAPTQKSKQGRKRKSREPESEQLSSESQAIGYPKEQYVPRLSRRRATHVIEEPIDFGVVPEKAIKAKRRKTVNAAGSNASVEAEKSELGSCAPEASATGAPSLPNTADPMSNEAVPTTTDTQFTRPEGEETTTSPAKQADRDDVFVKPSPRPKMDDPITSSAKQADSEAVSIKPSPKPKSSVKARRSHTTIFEDHVDLTARQRTPSLSQQQAKRKAALQDVPNEVSQRSQKSRRKVVCSDDEEDELALDASNERNDHDDHDANEQLQQDDEIEEAPKKRGRGRPSKAASKAKPKSAEKVTEDVDLEPDGHLEAAEAPAKRKRGRPSKTAVAAPEPETQAAEKDSAASGENNDEAQIDGANDTTNTTPSQTTRPTPPGMQAPTPSPEKPSSTPQKTTTKASPTLHSPLKSTSKVPLRVGLSKRQRIPSLLRMMKPPKR